MFKLPEFSIKIDFKNTYKRVLMLLTIMLIATSCGFGDAKATPQNVPAKKSEMSWLWPNPIDQVDPVTGIVKPEILNELDFAKSAGIDTVYLDATQIPWQIKNYENDPTKIESFRFAFDKMSFEANKRGLNVYAIIAGKGWASTNISAGNERVEDLIAAIEYLAKWNNDSRNSAKLTGITFDIEVHLLDVGNPTTQKIDFANYLNAISKTIQILKPTNLKLDITNSAYTDGTITQVYPNLIYNGTNAPLTKHLLNMLNSSFNGRGSVTLMAYRPSADGTIQIVKDEFAMVQKGNFSGVKINIAQETADEGVDNPTSSYFGLSPAFVLGEFAKIRTTYATNPSYGGLAIHHLVSYQELRK